MSGLCKCAADFVEAAGKDPDRISNADLSAVLTAAVRLYSRRSENTSERTLPLHADQLSTTEILTAACEMIRMTDVNIFDVSMWLSRNAH